MAFQSAVDGNCPSDQRMRWKSSADSVAAIDSTGSLFARAAGTASVTVSLRGDSAISSTAQIIVYQLLPDRILSDAKDLRP